LTRSHSARLLGVIFREVPLDGNSRPVPGTRRNLNFWFQLAEARQIPASGDPLLLQESDMLRGRLRVCPPEFIAPFAAVIHP
jgi:hypothetical protein